MGNQSLFRKRINITIDLILIWLLCIVVYMVFISLVKISIVYSVLILISETILCIMMWLFFNIKIQWLKDIKTGKEFNHLNFSNILSAIRFSLVPQLIAMFALLPSNQENFKFRISIFIFAVLVCLTDLFDGMIARKFNEVTRLGIILDPFGDFLMITSFATMLLVNNIIQWWFYILVMIRIPGLVIAALILIALKKNFRMKTTFLGKATIFYVLVHLGLSTIKLLLSLNIFYYDIFLFITQIIGALLIIASSAEKIHQLIVYLNNQDNLKKDQSGDGVIKF